MLGRRMLNKNRKTYIPAIIGGLILLLTLILLIHHRNILRHLITDGMYEYFIRAAAYCLIIIGGIFCSDAMIAIASFLIMIAAGIATGSAGAVSCLAEFLNVYMCPILYMCACLILGIEFIKKHNGNTNSKIWFLPALLTLICFAVRNVASACIYENTIYKIILVDLKGFGSYIYESFSFVLIGSVLQLNKDRFVNKISIDNNSKAKQLSDDIKKIEKLKRLLDLDVITEEEFKAKKKEIMISLDTSCDINEFTTSNAVREDALNEEPQDKSLKKELHKNTCHDIKKILILLITLAVCVIVCITIRSINDTISSDKLSQAKMTENDITWKSANDYDNSIKRSGVNNYGNSIKRLDSDSNEQEKELMNRTSTIRDRSEKQCEYESDGTDNILLSELDIGTSILFGEYVGYNFGTNNGIEWIVLDKTDNRILVISKYAVNKMQFDSGSKDEDYVLRIESDTDEKWLNSDLRGWLNSRFFNHAFSKYEQDRIVLETSLFLLSRDEVGQYLTGKDYLKCILADNSGGEIESCMWWLRTEKPNSDNIYVVGEDGNMSEDTTLPYTDFCYVRPAMWLSTNDTYVKLP